MAAPLLLMALPSIIGVAGSIFQGFQANKMQKEVMKQQEAQMKMFLPFLQNAQAQQAQMMQVCGGSIQGFQQQQQAMMGGGMPPFCGGYRC